MSITRFSYEINGMSMSSRFFHHYKYDGRMTDWSEIPFSSHLHVWFVLNSIFLAALNHETSQNIHTIEQTQAKFCSSRNYILEIKNSVFTIVFACVRIMLQCRRCTFIVVHCTISKFTMRRRILHTRKNSISIQWKLDQFSVVFYQIL